LKRTLVGIIAALLPLVATAASPGVAKQGAGDAACIVQAGAKGLNVRCPNASVAQLLAAFRHATGLRSECPEQLAGERVSVTLRRVQLHDALRSAFSAFNIAIWEDQSSPSVTWLRLVGLRRPSDGVQQARTEHQPAISYPEAVPVAETIPTQTASLFPPQDPGEMARVREAFASSISPGIPLAPPQIGGAANQNARTPLENRPSPIPQTAVPTTR
jgi:hypothetical protein